MRHCIFLAVATLLLADLAGAGPLASGNLTLDLRFAPPAQFAAATIGGTASGPDDVTLAAGTGFAGTQTVVPNISGVQSVRFQVGPHSAGTFSGTPLGGAVPIALDMVLVGPGATLGTLPIPLGSPFMITVPVGYTGTPTVSFMVTGGPWTAGAAMITGLSPYTGYITASTRTGTNMLTASGSGMVTLVAPVRIQSGTTSQPLFASLELVAVPEPTRALLFVWGAFWLALVGRGRRR